MDGDDDRRSLLTSSIVSASARDGISTGLRGIPERYQVMMPGGSTGAGNAKYLSGFRYGCRKQYSGSGRTRLDAPNLPLKHIQQ